MAEKTQRIAVLLSTVQWHRLLRRRRCDARNTSRKGCCG